MLWLGKCLTIGHLVLITFCLLFPEKRKHTKKPQQFQANFKAVWPLYQCCSNLNVHTYHEKILPNTDPDSVSLGGGYNFAFLTSSQVIPMLWFCGQHLEKPGPIHNFQIVCCNYVFQITFFTLNLHSIFLCAALKAHLADFILVL